MLAFAFETWRVLRMYLQTDVRNERSQAAIKRIGDRFEGILRAHHRIAADYTVQDSAIIATDWLTAKQMLRELLEGPLTTRRQCPLWPIWAAGVPGMTYDCLKPVVDGATTSSATQALWPGGDNARHDTE